MRFCMRRRGESSPYARLLLHPLLLHPLLLHRLLLRLLQQALLHALRPLCCLHAKRLQQREVGEPNCTQHKRLGAQERGQGHLRVPPRGPPGGPQGGPQRDLLRVPLETVH